MAAITSHIPSLRRQIKNVACNYSDAQVKVREATSNDPWGASSSLMSEIADLTYNAMAFTEIMQMIWKRLNDHGKNWRHVYKSLVLLDYLIKVGSEKVAQQCRENVYAIQTLKDFQHIEDNKDQGMNVREKAKQLVALLKDDERLKNERAKALMARKRFTQNGAGAGVGSDGRRYEMSRSDSELEECRPTSSGEEELQLQIALAISKEEADKEMETRKNDDMRLEMALQESKHGGDRRRPASTTAFMTGAGSSSSAGPSDFAGQSTSTKNSSALDDLLSLQPAVPAYSVAVGGHNNQAWGQPTVGGGGGDFFKATPLTSVGSGDPWNHSGGPAVNPNDDPFGDGTSANASGEFDYGTDPWSSSNQNGFGSGSGQSNLNTSAGHHQSAQLPGLSAPDPWGSDALAPSPVNANVQSVTTASTTAEATTTNNVAGQNRKLKTPDNFLGENAGLVNLDNLMAGSIKSTVPGMPPTKSGTTNPFSSSSSSNTASVNNPFAPTNQQRATPPTLNEIRASSALTNQIQPAAATTDPWANNAWTAAPSGAVTSPGSTNPFL